MPPTIELRTFLVEKVRLPEDFVKFMGADPPQGLGMESMADFVNFVADANGLDESIRQKGPEKFRQDGLVLSRLRQAWREAAARESGKEEQLRKGVEAIDLDLPLDETVTASLYDTFTKHYKFTLSVARCPSDVLLGRVKREIDRGLFTVIPLKRVKDLASTYEGNSHRVINLGTARLDLGQRSDVEVSIASRRAFSHALTVLMNAYAVAGCFKAPSGRGSSSQGPSPAEVLVAPWDTMVHYAEFVMDALEAHPGPEAEALGFIAKADSETRAHWVHLCRRPATQEFPRLTLGEAVLQSYTDKASLWVVPVKPQSAPKRPPPASQEQPNRQKRPNSQAPGKPKTQLIHHIDKQAVCKAWTDGRGCSGGCNKAHVCDVAGCKSPWSHPRTRHRY
jgi:hypothetical protein